MEGSATWRLYRRETTKGPLRGSGPFELEPGGVHAEPPGRTGWGSAPHRLPGHHRADRRRGRAAFQREAFGELRAAAAGDVDRREGLGFVGGDKRGDLAPIGGEDRVGRG